MLTNVLGIKCRSVAASVQEWASRYQYIRVCSSADPEVPEENETEQPEEIVAFEHEQIRGREQRR